ncbi:MAG TPA: tripartite tricarboxylate transporter substrate binding protein [Xanthobacteraceae bacterium]|nr:tripartite tricarboxylate transporter substrate binding protein [Xanthobacteraceae bacterium]
MLQTLARTHLAVIAAAVTVSLGVLAPSASAQAPAQSSAQTSAQTSAQAWPQRPVRFILPFGAGTATDVAARLMSEKLSARWGKPIVIENRPGADGLLAINAFISANDDHALLYASTASFMAHPYTLEKMPYNLERDFAPIARITDTVLAASVPSSVKANSLKEFVALAKAQPGKLNAAGAAGVPDFTLGYFLKLENLDVTRVPYKDVVQAATDLSGGQIQFLLSSYAVVNAAAESGRIRILAINVRERASFAPNIPSIHEAGYPSLNVETTAGFYGPRGMAQELRERIAKDVIAVVAEPEITKRLVATGQAVRTGGPAELTETLNQQAAQAATVAKTLGLKAGK